MTNTGGAPGSPSSGASVRPTSAPTPRNVKVFAVVRPPLICSVPWAVAHITSSPVPAMTSSSSVAWRWYSRNSSSRR